MKGYLQGEMQFSHISDETVQLVGKLFSVSGKKLPRVENLP
jgi:hypothetical protein